MGKPIIELDEESLTKPSRKMERLLFNPLGATEVDYAPGEILGVPQRAYAFLTPELSAKTGIKGMCTSNVNHCVFVSGYNRNGAFLAHLDREFYNEVPTMVEAIREGLGENIAIKVVSNKNGEQISPEQKESQHWLPEVLEALKPLSSDITRTEKGIIQSMIAGIDLEGKLIYPNNSIVNSSLDGLEGWHSVRSRIPKGMFRLSLTNLNSSKGLIICGRVFETPEWVLGRYESREAALEKLQEMHGDELERGDYFELSCKIAQRSHESGDVLIPL